VTARLETVGITKRFTNRALGTRITALDDVHLSVRDGEFLAIVGPSGCGKTTYLRILDGLIRADAGEVRLDGVSIVAPTPRIGFVFQADSLMPWETVLDNVALGLSFQGRRSEFARARELVKRVGLAGFERYFPHQLSGGMRQRVNLARALAIDPEVLLMDEPFAALDAQTREIMQEHLLRIWSASGKTVVFITHQIEEAIFLADRVAIFSAQPGRVQELLPIPFDRPRDLRIKRTPEFTSLADHIWSAIEAQVRQSIASEIEGVRP
jgi:NitT/TauT family transport system ATP-binding protein